MFSDWYMSLSYYQKAELHRSLFMITKDGKFLFCLHRNLDTVPSEVTAIDHANIDEKLCVDLSDGYCQDENTKGKYELVMQSLYDPRLSPNPLVLLGFQQCPKLKLLKL